jgi:radical SAM-linked protein
MTAQRLRVWFRKGERVRYISHLDVLRHWERAIRRAGLPLSYSQGFTPHPKLQFAGPLPLGFVADAEIVDVTLDTRVPVEEFRARVAANTTPDLALVAVKEVPPGAPPPQAVVTWADYDVHIPGVDLSCAVPAVAAFLARAEFPWTEERKDRQRTYDLRAGVARLQAAAGDEGGTVISMRLAAHQDNTVRPEQVVAAILPGAEPALIRRRALHLQESSPAHDAYRRRGRFLE